METDPEPTLDAPSKGSEQKITRKSIIGFLFLVLLVVLISVPSGEEKPAWVRELPRRITPPIEVPQSPAGPVRLSGVVHTSEGRVLRDALISTRTGTLLTWDYSDADGQFSLEGLPDGEVILRVVGDGHQPEEFTLSSSEPEARLTLSTPHPEAPSLPELVRVDVSGVVSTPRSRWGLEGYELWLDPLSPAYELGAPLARRVTVQADRSVSFEGLLSGRYRAALLPPWAKAATWPNLLDPETPLITIGLSEESHLEFEMVAGEIEGTVIDDKGKLVAKAIVNVYPKDQPEHVWPHVRTDMQGHFVLRDLPVGDYVLHAHAGDLSVEHLIQMPGSSTLKIDLSLRR